MTQVTVVTGCAGAGKTERLLDAYRVALDQACEERRPGTTLWLTPTRRIQHAVIQALIARSGKSCFSPNVLTFDLFAEKILEAAGRPATPISPVVKRLLLRRIAVQLLEQGELRHFNSISGTTGFLDVVSSFISELKREEIWPEQFVAACQQRTTAFARRDLELGLIYARYQQHLTEQNWYDNEGRFWLARTAIGDGVRGPFANVRCLVADGFADFTQTQYEILGFLAGWIAETTISLPVEHPVTRADLFSKSQAAIARIRQHLPEQAAFVHQQISNATDTMPQAFSVRRRWSNSICVVADRLFSNPRMGQSSNDATGLEIIAATGPIGEWEAVARRLKQMLAGNVDIDKMGSRNASAAKPIRPQDIVIGLRAISDDGPRLRDYLTSAGLPVWCEAESPMTSSSIFKAVSSLFQFELDDWPFDRLIGVLDSTFFQPNWPEAEAGRATRAVAAILRRLQIHAGRDLILRVVSRYATDANPTSTTRSDSPTTLARLAAPLLVRLSRSLDKLRRSHTLNDWADILATIADDFGWTRRSRSPSDQLALKESREFDLLQRILRTAAEADQQLAGQARPRRLTLAEFNSELRDLLSHETINSPPETGGCIRILSVEQIRNLDVPHLFLIGLTENSFPMNRGDDCLFSESERQDFNARGIALRHRSSQHVDEMSLFYSVVTRARKSLTLSYPAVNSKGQPVFPSPYLTAVTSLFSKAAVTKSQEGQLDPVPTAERVLTQTDLRLFAMDEALRGSPQLYRAVMEFDPLRRSAFNTLAACEVAGQRFHERGFTAYEGRLEGAQNLDSLRRRFGAHHQFSATELESYARCPFQFWLSNVLKIGAVESPEESTDYAGRGTMLHEVLATLLTDGALTEPAELPNRFRELVKAELDRRIPETDLQRALIQAEREILFRWADAFAAQQSEYAGKIGDELKRSGSLAPEIPFGNLPDAPNVREDSHPPIQFGTEDRSVNLRGRIDRVDIGLHEGHPAFVIVDYKTGQRPTSSDDDVVSGRSIQLALYLLAIKRLGLAGPNAVPFQMGFWALQDTGFKPGVGGAKFKRISAEKVQWFETVLDNLLPQLAEEIRSGRFVVENEDKNCTGRCAYRTVCRVNQLRPLAESLGKRSQPRIHPEISDETDSE